MVLVFIVNRRLTIAWPNEYRKLFFKSLRMGFWAGSVSDLARCHPRRPAPEDAGRRTHECVAQISGCTPSVHSDPSSTPRYAWPPPARGLVPRMSADATSVSAPGDQPCTRASL